MKFLIMSLWLIVMFIESAVCKCTFDVNARELSCGNQSQLPEYLQTLLDVETFRYDTPGKSHFTEE